MGGGVEEEQTSVPMGCLGTASWERQYFMSGIYFIEAIWDFKKHLPKGREEELKSLLMKVKQESEKAGLTLSIQRTKVMASGPITSWQIDGETVESVQTLFLEAPKSLQMVTAAIKLKDTYSLDGKL